MAAIGFSYAASMMQQQVKLSGPQDKPSHYTEVNDPSLSYSDEGNGLTPPMLVSPEAKVKILSASDKINQQLTMAAGGPSTTTFQAPVQLQGHQVQVADMASGKPEIQNNQGRLTGNPDILQAYTSANQSLDWAQQQLGRKVPLAGNAPRLTVLVNDPIHADEGAHQDGGKASVALPDSAAAQDADTVHHEAGHAVLDGARPELRTGEVHEGYADGTALFTALQNKDVRADVLDKLHKGTRSNVASVIGEGYEQEMGKDPEHPSKTVPKTEGLRDLAAKPPPSSLLDPHAGSQDMSSAAYNSVIDKFQDLKKANPKANEDDLLKQASQGVGRDFARATDFLAVGGGINQTDFAHAMIKANQVDGGGADAALYKKNFTAAGVPVTDDHNDAMDQHLAAAKVSSPGGLLQAPGFRSTQGQSAPQGTQAEADAWLKANSKQLSLGGTHYRATELYHNDRGETFIHYSTGKHRDDVSAGTRAMVAFDKTGKLLDVQEGIVMPPFASPFTIPNSNN